MTPRKQQLEAIDFCLSSLKGLRRAVVQMPTGSGKSLVLVKVAAYWRQLGRPVYVIAPSVEAVQQLRITAARLGMLADVETARQRASPRAPFVITTYGCAWRRSGRRVTPETLCLLDECHHVNYAAPVNSAILGSFARAVGFSATPWSKGCGQFFDRNRYQYKLSAAIADGICSDYAISDWCEPQTGTYQIIYTSGQGSIDAFCRSLRPCDYAVYSRRDARKIIARFRQGAVGTIVVNRMLTEGFDQPQTKRVWLHRSTASSIAAMQMAGRALRPHGGAQARIFVGSHVTKEALNRALHKAG